MKKQSILVIKSRSVLKYHEHIEKKGFQVIAHGNSEEVNRAKEILENKKVNTIYQIHIVSVNLIR